MEIITVRGSEFETGAQVGRLFAAEMAKSAAQGAEYLKNPDIARDFEAVKAKLAKRYPDSLEQLRGRAQGAGVDADAYLLYVCAEVYEGRNRCTDIMVRTRDGGALLAHNEDGEYNAGNCALVRYQLDGGFSFYDFSATDALPGASFCMNSHGLVFTMNYMQMTERQRDGVPVWFVLRQAVNARNTDELLTILKSSEFASGFNMNAVDPATARIFTIEGKLGAVDAVEVEDTYVHTNHFIHPCFDAHYSSDDSNTLYRLAKARELLGRLGREPKADDLRAILYYHNDSYYNSILETPAMSDFITACTFIYDSREKKACIHSHITGGDVELENTPTL